MNGGDISPVQLLQSHQQAANPKLTRIPWVRSRQPILQNRIWSGSISTLLKLFQTLQRLLQALADAGTQLFSRRIGERHHQQTVESMIGLRDQTETEMGQGKGFTCASTCLEQADPGTEGVRVGIEALSHG